MHITHLPTHRTKGYNYALVATCKDKETLQAYAMHPYHTEIKEKFLFVNCVASETMAFDYEF